jgi:hypothetical protein
LRYGTAESSTRCAFHSTSLLSFGSLSINSIPAIAMGEAGSGEYATFLSELEGSGNPLLALAALAAKTFPASP